MDISLEKVDMVVDRTGVTFAEAKEALEKTDGDVVDAIVLIEKNRTSWSDDMADRGQQMIDKVKEILRKGNVTKITVKKDGEVLMNIPITAAALGSLISAPLALIGLGSAIISKCTIEVLKEDGEVININNLVAKNINSNRDDFEN
ncbi:Ubiquitin-associated-domain-containing protein [[Clostridium] ultunense Esp]|uniref:Ubiquitin-associated-domain-containing protein n=1 Tax=[Clostridium] ultunense Esp TaxID=1288971 RepID=M1ZGJ4_9FIRM|nr:DUF4342 domain-containing protein [Schnuerera ultunensis]CCQ97373.1 Ubiquitin-associated-domain-containing protein [[Clostridium] ultunense Esp]SHD77422.1 Ubiquitin-associated-domain-containing protein [[Clostridium] ultunense Esp]